MENQIVEYIEQAKRHGLSEMEIKQNLLGAGWEAGEVENAFIMAKAQEKIPPASKTEELKTAHQDFEAGLQNQFKSPQSGEPGDMPVTNPIQHQPVVSVSQQTQPALPATTGPTAKKSKKALIILLIFIGIALAGGGGYAAYWYYANNPDYILKKVIKQPTLASNTFKFSYSDAGNGNESKVLASLAGQGYFDARDASSTKFSLDLNASLQTGELTLSRELKLLGTADALYFKLGEIPQFNELSGSPVEWLKLDLNKLNDYTAQTGITKDELSKKQAELMASTERNYQNNKFLVADKKVRRENLNGEPVFHLSLKFDEEKFKTFLSVLLDDFRVLNEKELKNGGTDLAGSYNKIKEAASKFLEYYEVKQIELWVGRKDHYIHKILFVSNAPSLAGSNLEKLNPLYSARALSRDAKRMADIRMLASALELYYNDHGGYPEGKDGVPVDLASKYISSVPIAPEPADGNCTGYYNAYWYQPTGQPKLTEGKNLYQNYEYTFCLGENIGGYEAGINKLTMSGIQKVEGCPAGDNSKCFGNNPAPTQSESANFNAEFIFENTVKDLGQEKQITPPADALEVMDIISGALGQAQEKSRDAKRLADVRMVAAGLELYFNDNNSYPKQFIELVPNYLGVLPVAPTPPGGSCSETDNAYAYAQLTPVSYQLSFCLGEDIGGYSAGKRVLTQMGIQ